MAEDILDILLGARLLNALTKEELEEIAEHPQATLVRIPEGEVVYDAGSPARAFYFIGDGEFEVIGELEEEPEKGVHRLNLLYPGEFFGDLELRFGGARRVTIRAVEASTVGRIEEPLFSRLLEQDTRLVERLDRLAREIEKRTLISFPGQRDDEVILLFSRRHWVALVLMLVRHVITVGLFGMLLLGCIAVSVVMARSETLALSSLSLNTLSSAPAVLLLAFFLITSIGFVASVVWRWLDWYNDYLIITNERIIHIDRIVLLETRRDEVPLNKVQNVNLTDLNPISEFFGYGTLIIDTAAQGTENLVPPFEFMPKVEEARQRILIELNRENSKFVQESQDARKRNLLAKLGRAPEPPQEERVDPAPPPKPPPPGTDGITRMGFAGTIFRYFYPESKAVYVDRIVWRKSRWRLTFNSVGPWLLFIGSAILFLLMQPAIAAVAPSPESLPVLDEWNRWRVFLTILYFGALTFWIWWIYEDWRNEQYILTQDAIIAQEEKPLGLQKNVRSASLDTIQNVTYHQYSPLMVILNIGNVNIQTAGQQGQLNFRYVRDPASVQSDIFRFIERRQRQRASEEAGQVREELLELIRLYDETVRADADTRPMISTPPPQSEETHPSSPPSSSEDTTIPAWPFD